MEIQPPGGNINYSIHMQKLCFLYDEKAVPQVEVKSRKTKENGISHIRENGSHSSYEGNH